MPTLAQCGVTAANWSGRSGRPWTGAGWSAGTPRGAGRSRGTRRAGPGEGDPSRAPEFSEIFVVLMAPDGPDELLAEVQAGQHRVGTLGHADSEEFRAIFAAGETPGRAVGGEPAPPHAPHGPPPSAAIPPLPTQTAL